MVRKPGDLCFEVSLESDKGLTMTDLSFALKFFVYGHPKNVCIHKDDLEVVEGKYYAVLNEHGFVNGVLFCEAEIVETINGINRIVSVRSNTGYMIGNCCQPSVGTSSCAHGYSLSLYKVEYVPQPIDPNPEEDQLVAEELFGERLSLPELTADRAIADEHGNRIADTYETRQAVRNHIRAVYNEQFTENPPLILEEYITPNMLSQDVKDMLSQAGATINNVPDGEDLTTKQGVLKLSDKPYNPGAYSGLGRVYLRKNLVGGQNLLTQAMVSKPNTIYILQYDYTLDGKSITIPEGCVLSYEGGSIRDGHINYTDTLILGTDRISNVTTSGTCRHAALPTDEEDITGANGKNLKFKDKEYAPQDYSGLGRIYLRKNMVEGKNVLTQEMVSKPNTIYIIQYDYDLNGAEITIPEGCVLDFQGGSFNNGTIIGNKCVINTSQKRVFTNINIKEIGNKEILSLWFDWSNINFNSVILQSIMNSIFYNGGGVFMLYDSISYTETINVLTAHTNSYTGDIVSIKGFSTETSRLNHIGNSDAINIIGQGERSASCFSIEDCAISNSTSGVTELCAAIKLSKGGSHFTLKNVNISSTPEVNNYGIYSPDSWVYNIIDCFIHSYVGIYIDKGTSCYLRNIMLGTKYKGIVISGGYCVIENVFGDYCLGTLVELQWCSASISSIASESQDLDLILHIGNKSNVVINTCYFYKPFPEQASIFRCQNSIARIQQCRIVDNKPNENRGYLIQDWNTSVIIIEHLDIEEASKFKYSQLDSANSTGTITKVNTLTGYRLDRSSNIISFSYPPYADWYMESPKYPNNANILFGFGSSPLLDSNGQSLEWDQYGRDGAILVNANNAQPGECLGWVKVGNGSTRESAYKTIPVLECVKSKEDLPTTSFEGNCIFCGNKPVWWTGTKWVDATGTEV